jgi:hypothetical protein
VLSSSINVSFDQLSIRIANNQPSWSALALGGALVGVNLCDNIFSAAIGIRSADPAGGQTGLTDLRIEDNVFECEAIAVQLSGVTIHQFLSHISGNRIAGCREAGIVLTGATVPGHGVSIAGNVIAVEGSGIVSALDGLRVLENDVLQVAEAAPGDRDGIRLMPGMAIDDSLDNVRVVGNHIAGFRGAGIHIRAPRARALNIGHNRIERSGHGIVFEGPQLLDRLAIEDNQLSNITGFGIRAEGGSATLATTRNQIEMRSPDPAVLLMFGRGESVFADNQCLREGGGAASADVILAGGTLIVASNRVQAAELSMDLHVSDQRFTVLGNVCRGRILVNGSALPAPWLPLNLQNVS